MARTRVLVKRAGRRRVAYFRTDRNSGQHEFDAESFVREGKVPFADFVAQADAARACAGAAAREEEGGEAAGSCSRPSAGAADGASVGAETLYCQESLTGHPELELEFKGWDWPWILRLCARHGWGLPETNVLFMGSEGATTPAHFDEQHNFLSQVRGRKLVVLFPPDDYTRLYPFPVTHPCDRCSMVDVESADLVRFPRFSEARGHYAMLEPGDLLYIPYGWWHYCRTVTHLAASITFWAEVRGPSAGSPTSLPATMGPSELLRVRRNLEKLLAEDVGAPELGQEVLRLLGLVERGEMDDPRLNALRKMLGMLQFSDEEQLAFISETFNGRFGFDVRPYV
eukprot:CAMPEP_0204597714 /NCGR_PEP_ID=MMETSP0661-20131031/53947_1 /ASSEMBLY_ACC=CAM_ASM_000606 /TAXON_ID=109239 /ORGANISM="Alexandrium margalefi, Strain AMGDE01CS-322" /LENGTH=340 /DNA_ID=CAMNT_0051608411 /DNA_START=27 /DNA_END=1049 /DNA_ORIENTATION=+